MSEESGCLDANYNKGLLANQERTGVIEEGENGNAEKRNTREILQVLRQEVGAETFEKWGVAIVTTLQQNGLLQQRVYEKSNVENRTNVGQNVSQRSCNSEKNKRVDTQTEQMSNLWEREEFRCPSQGWKLAEQQRKQLDCAMQKLSHERTSPQEYLQNLWETSEGLTTLQQTLYPFQEIWRPNVLQRQNLRIRRLTPRETWRLQGFTDEQFDKAQAAGVSDTRLYQQAGNAVSCNITYAIGLALKNTEKETKENHENS